MHLGFDSSILSSHMDLRKATMLRKSPKDLLPNGGSFMDESHGTINPFKKKHKNKSKRTKLLSNKTIQIKQAQQLKNSRYLRGWKWVFFYLPSHHTLPPPPKIIVRSASKVPIGHAGATSSLPTAARRVAINGPASVDGNKNRSLVVL